MICWHCSVTCTIWSVTCGVWLVINYFWSVYIYLWLMHNDPWPGICEMWPINTIAPLSINIIFDIHSINMWLSPAPPKNRYSDNLRFTVAVVLSLLLWAPVKKKKKDRENREDRERRKKKMKMGHEWSAMG